MKVTLLWGPENEPPPQRLLRLPEVRLQPGALSSAVEAAGVSIPVEYVSLTNGEDRGSAEGDGRQVVVVGSGIPDGARTRLESRGHGWIDTRGAIHIHAPRVLIHIDRTPGAQRERTSDRSGVGSVGIRTVQAIVDSRIDGPWAVSELAELAQVSIGQAHRVLALLESDGLLHSTGRGAARRRFVAARPRLLDWLAAADRQLGRPPTVLTYLYAREPYELAQRLVSVSRERGLDLAITGPLAARAMGAPTLTSMMVRARVADTDTEEVLSILDLPHLEPEEAGRGANLDLILDRGRLGTSDAREVDGLRVAPPSRVWLDLLRGSGREPEIAARFREEVLDAPR